MASTSSVTGVTPLHLAAESGDVDKVRELLQSGEYNVNCTDSNGRTPLHYACIGGNKNLVQTLIRDYKADIKAKDSGDNTPLNVAAMNGKKDITLFLFNEFESDINAKDSSGMTLIHKACQGGDVSLVQTLIQDHKADINVKDGKNSTPLHVAASCGKKEVALFLINEMSYDINIKDSSGRTLLHKACSGGNVSLVKSLIRDHKANISVKDHQENTPLHVAALSGKKEVVLFLINEVGCDITDKGNLGWSLLHSACSGGNVSLIKTLIREHKADINARDDESNTPLHVAALCGNEGATLCLIKDFPSDINDRDASGRSLLHNACCGGNTGLVQAVIKECEGNIYSRDKYNNTPLHVAALSGKEEVAMLLIRDHGCGIKIRGHIGRSVLHSACKGGNVSLVQTLIQDHKADVNAEDNQNNTPLHVAALSGKEEVAMLLIRDHGCDIKIRGHLGRSVLHSACNGGNVSLVQTLIRTYNADINAGDDENNTPLHVAALSGKEEVALLLINKLGCNLNTKGSHGRSLLHFACSGGNMSLIKSLIQDFRANVNAKDDDGCNPLHLAALCGNEEIALYFISKRWCHTSSNGKSLLYYACSGGSVNLVKILIQDYNADEKNTLLHAAALNGKQEVMAYLISYFDCTIIGNRESGRHLIHSACIGGNADLVRMLIQVHTADFKVTDRNRDLPLHVAAENGREAVVFLLINEFNCDINIRGCSGKTLLHKACEGGNVSLVKNLIRKNNVDINANDYNNNTPLHVAARCGNKEVALFLINEMGCDMNVKGYLGQSLLHSACNGGNVSLVQTLIQDYNADISARDDENNTPLHVAALNGNKDVALFLLNKIDSKMIDSKGHLGRSLLHSAVYEGNISLIKTLIYDYNADINVKDDQNLTPLHMALSYNKLDTVSVIITDFERLGFKVDDKLPNGDSLLHLACKKGHYKLIKSLCEVLSPVVYDNEGNTPLHICSKLGHKECVKLLLEKNAPVLISNKSEETPKDVAQNYEIKNLFCIIQDDISVDYNKMQEHARKRYSGTKSVRLFIIGNPGAGKSSLIESLKREGFLKSRSRVSESTVPPHTAGIVPSIYTSKHYGRVQFYDFAGDPEYYSSHAAILENLASSSKGDNIFILVTDLRKDNSAIESALHYWFLFIQNQKFKNKPSLIIIGSHSDLLSRREVIAKSKVLGHFCENKSPNLIQEIAHFIMDCCKPRSKEMSEIQKKLIGLTANSPTYPLSTKASILLGLLEKDFSNVTACPVSRLVSHIKDTGVHLPNKAELLHPILHELHEVGILLLIGDRTKHDYHIILNTSQLTITVHKKLFSKDKGQDFNNERGINIGIISEALLERVLPQYITKECLIHLQYCQEMKHEDLGPSFDEPESCSLFFPALCVHTEDEEPWNRPPNSYCIGWLAQCIDSSYDYFPPRFLHVLLLRIVFRFTLTAPGRAVNDHFQRRCTMWKTGVHWQMEEGVECRVQMVDIEKGSGVVVATRSERDFMENCISIFNSIISCVMETMKEFCHSIRPQFFLLDSTQQDEYLNRDNHFAMSDVERVLASSNGNEEVVVSVIGIREMKRSKLLCMRKLTHWNSLFPIELCTILHFLRNLVRELFNLGLELGIPRGVLDAIEADYDCDTERRRRELVRGWMKSSLDPPCWWRLVEALRKRDMGATANEIKETHSESL